MSAATLLPAYGAAVHDRCRNFGRTSWCGKTIGYVEARSVFALPVSAATLLPAYGATMHDPSVRVERTL